MSTSINLPTTDTQAESQGTKALLNDAVNNTSMFSRKGFLDRIFTKWFNRLVYPQIWEDPEVDIEALKLQQGSRIFTISSGGCNAMNYITTSPESVTVVDLNEAHIALIKLKKAAIKHLPDYESFFDFFGRANLNKNLDAYEIHIKPHLDQATIDYWEGKEKFWSTRRIEYFTNGFYQHGLLGRFIGLIHWISKRLGYDISKVMQAHTSEEQQQLFDQHVAPVFDTRLVKFLCNRSMVMYSLGIPPAQFDEMEQHSKQEQQTMSDLLKERARRLACDFPLEDNYFAWQAFNREYDIKHRQAVPRYLKKEFFEMMKLQMDKISVHHMSITERLKQMPAKSLDAYLFLDAQDWMDENQLTELWREVNRTASDKAHVVFRTAGEISPLEEKLPVEVLANWKTDAAANQQWTLNDRSAIYGGVHAYIRTND